MTPPASAAPGAGRLARRLLAAALAAAVAGAFSPVLGNRFLDYDDDTHVTASPPVLRGLHAEGVRWALRATDAANWMPLTRLSHMADVSLFGLDPRGHHLTSLLLHAANTAGLFLVLRGYTGTVWPSAAAAGLFGLHPLRVEPVAWAAERKELLAFFVGLLALAAYRRFVSRPGPGRMALVALALGLALAAKPTVVTLPAALVLLDVWPLGRLRRAGGIRAAARLLAEKVPLFALAALAGLVTLVVQARAGATLMIDAPLGARFANAAVSYARYLGQSLFPARLSFFYPYPEPSWPARVTGGALLVVAGVSLAAWLLRRRRPWVGVGWLWFLVTLVPMIGLVQVGWQAMADRYTYLPHAGLCVVAAWEAASRSARRGPWRRAGAAAALAALAAFALLARRQTGVWRDPGTLYAHAVAVDGDNWLARQNLGVVQLRRGDLEGAVTNLEAAVSLRPGHANAWHQLGGARYARREYDAAIAAYERVIRIAPEHAEAWYHLGGCRLARREPDAAIEAYRRSLALDPGRADAWTNLAAAYWEAGRLPDALAASDRALAIDPRHPIARENREAIRRRLAGASPR